MGLLGIAIVNGFVSLASLLHSLFLLLFPLLVEGFLVVGKEGVDLLVERDRFERIVRNRGTKCQPCRRRL